MAELTIGDLSKRTGIAVPTLRSWEGRFGFPDPVRLPSGHRRYDEATVAVIGRVVKERSLGLSLEAAIERSRVVPGSEPSIFAGLRAAAPELPAQVMGARSMLAISRAIEDECYAHGDSHVIFGAFQTERAFRRAAHRWRELGRTGDYALAFAGFRRPRLSSQPQELPLKRTSVVRREWAVVCESPTFSACLAGWERPKRRSGSPARFEAIWTVEPKLVRAASMVCVDLVAHQQPELAQEIAKRLQSQPDLREEPMRSATIVTNRVVGYLDEPVAG